ncbi:MAG TPA: endonuclease NucS domain-containing protein [Pseudonocardiaceae bacterium]
MREQLAQHLNLIEPGLRLIETEYSIPNAEGTRGRIDILARDGHGSWVVIELKRADGTARQALHEVTKYAELLRQEMGLRQDRVRAVIVSTTWKELLVPVSNMARDWSHDLRGYLLILGSDGEPVRADRVTLLSAPVVPKITPIHFIYFFDSPEDRERGWQQVVDRAAEVGAHDLFAADFRRISELDLVRAPFGLYFALGQINRADPPPHINAVADDPDEEGRGYHLEYEVLCHITRHVFDAGFDSAEPGVLRQLVEDPCWTIERYRTAGAFVKRSLLDSQDMLRDLNGDDEGIGRILYTGSARTTDRGRWPAFLSESMRSLEGNQDWTVLVQHWLADVAAQRAESDVVLHVYNPCDLICSFTHGWPDDLSMRLPMLFGTATTHEGPRRSIRGSLYWNCIPVPDIAGHVRRVYEDPLRWSIARVTGGSWKFDMRLIEQLGLRYMFIEYIGENPFMHSDGDHVSLWMLRNGHPSRLTAPFKELHEEGWYGADTLDSFIEQHCAQLEALVAEYRHVLGFQPQSSSTPREGPDVGPRDPEEPPHPSSTQFRTVRSRRRMRAICRVAPCQLGGVCQMTGWQNPSSPSRTSMKPTPIEPLRSKPAQSIARPRDARPCGSSRHSALSIPAPMLSLRLFMAFRTSVRRLAPTTSSESATS